MSGKNFFRTILFLVFFSVGASALSTAILCEDIIRHYQNKEAIRINEEFIERLKGLKAKHDALIANVRKDPSLLEKIAHPMIGVEPNDVNTVYPHASDEVIEAVKKLMEDEPGIDNPDIGVPVWVARCSEQPKRTFLFLAGSFLVIISFIWFGTSQSGSIDE